MRIDLLSVTFLAAVAFVSIPLASGESNAYSSMYGFVKKARMFPIELNAGLVGLSLTYAISLADMLQYTIRLSAEVENIVRMNQLVHACMHAASIPCT
jgi:hypothetical protein